MAFLRSSAERRRLGNSGTLLLKLGLVLLTGACGGRDGLAFETGLATGGSNGEVGNATANTAGAVNGSAGGMTDEGGAIGVDSGGSGPGGAGMASDGGASVGGASVGGASVGGASVGGASVGGAGGAPAGTPAIGGDGYVKINAGTYTLGGYVGSFVGGSASSIALSYGPTSFCASGTVGRNSTYLSYAGAGFSVSQTSSPTGGAVNSLPLSGNSITLSFTNQVHSPLRLQVIDSGVDYWCYDIANVKSPVTIPLSKLNTQCWDNSGTAFKPGTPITEIELIVPGSAALPIPYNFCLTGLTIQ